MAIIIESEKKPINWMAFGVIGLLLLLIFGGGYYVFFQKPPLIDVVLPEKLQDISKISDLAFDPQAVVQSSLFTSLKDFSFTLPLPIIGKENPFRP